MRALRPDMSSCLVSEARRIVRKDSASPEGPQPSSSTVGDRRYTVTSQVSRAGPRRCTALQSFTSELTCA